MECSSAEDSIRPSLWLVSELSGEQVKTFSVGFATATGHPQGRVAVCPDGCRLF